MVKNALIMLIFGVSNSFGESISLIKYEQNQSIFEILAIDNFAIFKKQLPHFFQWLIYLKKGPKVFGNDRQWDPFWSVMSNLQSSLESLSKAILSIIRTD